MRRFFVVSSLFLAITSHAQQKDIDARVERILAQLTLEEKLGQLTQLVPDQPEFSPALSKGLVGSILNGGGSWPPTGLPRGTGPADWGGGEARG